MKTICVIKDGRLYWSDIEGYLKTANANVTALDLKSVLQGISDKNFDIVIAGERSYREISAIPQNIPKLVISEGNIEENRSKGIYVLKWPASKEAFLEMTSRLLYISERRVFRTVITASYKGRPETFLGKSLNFSMSGMAFKLDKPLKIGDILAISFFIPNSDERLNIDMEVMRISNDPADGSVYYGAKFLNIEKGAKEDLDNFIRKIK